MDINKNKLEVNESSYLPGLNASLPTDLMTYYNEESKIGITNLVVNNGWTIADAYSGQNYIVDGRFDKGFNPTLWNTTGIGSTELRNNVLFLNEPTNGRLEYLADIPYPYNNNYNRFGFDASCDKLEGLVQLVVIENDIDIEVIDIPITRERKRYSNLVLMATPNLYRFAIVIPETSDITYKFTDFSLNSGTIQSDFIPLNTYPLGSVPIINVDQFNTPVPVTHTNDFLGLSYRNGYYSSANNFVLFKMLELDELGFTYYDVNVYNTTETSITVKKITSGTTTTYDTTQNFSESIHGKTLNVGFLNTNSGGSNATVFVHCVELNETLEFIFSHVFLEGFQPSKIYLNASSHGSYKNILSIQSATDAFVTNFVHGGQSFTTPNYTYIDEGYYDNDLDFNDGTTGSDLELTTVDFMYAVEGSLVGDARQFFNWKPIPIFNTMLYKGDWIYFSSTNAHTGYEIGDIMKISVSGQNTYAIIQKRGDTGLGDDINSSYGWVVLYVVNNGTINNPWPISLADELFVSTVERKSSLGFSSDSLMSNIEIQIKEGV